MRPAVPWSPRCSTTIAFMRFLLCRRTRGGRDWRHIGFEVKSSCERCGHRLAGVTDARVCSYDCTFCADCASAMNDRCPNCNGVLAVPTGAA
jgi:hypothetical protein